MKGGFMAALLLPSSRALQRRLPSPIHRSLYGIGRRVLAERDGPKRSAASDFGACDGEPIQLVVGLRRSWRMGPQCRSFASSAEQAVDEGEDGGETQPVLEYLQSVGINVTALEGVELPKQKSIMKERLDYLKDVIGLSVKDINEYPLMIGCSVRKNLSPVVQYLLDLKVTKNSLPQIVRKYPQVLHSSVAMDLIPNVRFIQGLGVELKQVGSLLTRYPQVLGYRIEGTMSTSVAYLVMIGVDKRQIAPVLTEKPEIMGMRVSNNLRPKVEFIVSCGIPRLVVGKMIENRPYILDYDVDGKMRPAVDALLELGVRKEALPQMLLQYPELLGTKVKDKVEAKLPWLTAKVGVRREDMAAILEKLPQILAMNVPTGTKRVHALRGLGLTKEEVAQMIVACPQLIGLSIEKRIAPNGEFMVTEMKRDIRDLLAFPAFLTYDLLTRIQPRFEKVKEKGVHFPLAWMLNCSDAKFEDRLKTGDRSEGGEEVDASFDTVGRLRVHEDVPSDDESEDKHRTLRHKNRSLLRGQSLRANPSPMVKHQEDKNGPSKQTYRDPPSAQASRPTPIAHDRFEDENRMSRQVHKDLTPAQARRPRSVSLRMMDSSDEEVEDDYEPPEQSFRDSSRAETPTPMPVYWMDSSDEELEDDHLSARQDFREPQASRPRPMHILPDFSDEVLEDDYFPARQDFSEPRSSRLRPLPMMPDAPDVEVGEDDFLPSKQSLGDAPCSQASEPRHVSMMPEYSEDEVEDVCQPSKPMHRGSPRPRVYRPRPMVDYDK